MNKKEVFEIIRNLRIKHGITLGEIEDIQQKETERLSSIEKIFDMSSQYDVDLLVALIYLLNEDPKPVYEWFKTNHKNCKYLSESRNPNPFGISKIIAGSRVAAITGNAFGGRIPLVGAVIAGGVGGLLGYMPNNQTTSKFKNDENYYNKLLIAAFIQNPLFFSMAWNWNIFNLNSISENKSVLRISAWNWVSDYEEYGMAASGGIYKKLLEKECEDFGNLYITGLNEDSHYKINIKFILKDKASLLTVELKYKERTMSDWKKIIFTPDDFEDGEAIEIVPFNYERGIQVEINIFGKQ